MRCNGEEAYFQSHKRLIVNLVVHAFGTKNGATLRRPRRLVDQ